MDDGLNAGTHDGYVIRVMRRDELDFAVGLAANEGWNPGVHDADCFYSADPDGFLIGVLDGEPIGCISAVRYGSTYGFVGFYIIKPGYRGRGYGLRLWQAAMRSLDGRDVGLDGVTAQVGNYAKSGFAAAFTSTRYRGEGGDATEADARVVDLARLPFEAVAAYDAAVFAYPRVDFLRCWMSRPGMVALGSMDGDRLAGYGVVRSCADGFKIGPLFADDADRAELLFAALCSRVPRGAAVFLDVPGEAQNPAATALAQRHGMTPVFETARMYRLREGAAAMPMPLERWFGVTSFELG